jgi:hypothetical protein
MVWGTYSLNRTLKIAINDEAQLKLGGLVISSSLELKRVLFIYWFIIFHLSRS